MNVEKNIRKLAKSSYYQNIYRTSKEISGINLFENTSNFSGLQHLFLYWIKIYNILYDDLVNKEFDNLTEEVLEDDLRTDAFLYYKKVTQEKKIDEYRKQDRTYKMKNKKGKPGNYQKFPIYRGPLNKGE